MPPMPQHVNAAQRAKVRTMLVLGGFLDIALAAFFLGWGAEVFEIEPRVAWLIAAALALGGVSIFVAALAFGRRRSEQALDRGNDDGPVVRR